MAEKIFKEYYNRLAKEGWLKALICGLIVAFATVFVSATTFWTFAIKQLWLVFVIFAVVAIGATLISYFVKFRPSTKDIARRVDALGLEERLLTMAQLQNDNSYIAMKQREDALNALKAVHAQDVKIAISAAMLVVLAISSIFSVGATTVYALSTNGKLPSGGELLGVTKEEQVAEYELLYEETDGGVIEGEIFQIVEEGQSASAVEAIPDDGYYFAGWVWIQEGKECSSEDPYRLDENIRESMVFTAMFAELPDDGEEGEGEGEGEGESDQGENAPPQDGQPSDGNGDQPPPPSGNEAEGGGGDMNEDNKQIINGETFYGGSTLEDAEGQAKDKMDGNENISDGEKDIVGDYYDTIRDK